MKSTIAMAGLLALGFTSIGCAKKADNDGTKTVALEGLPKLTARVPIGTEVSKNAVGIGVMLKGPGVSMTIGPDLEVDAASLEAATKNAESYSPTNLASETLDDGYILTYESDSDMGTNYWLVGRRQFSDAAYSCGVSSPKKDHQQSAIEICKSLRK